MAPPAFDDDDEVVEIMLWSPRVHDRCYLMQRTTVELILSQCRGGDGHAFGMLPLEVVEGNILRRLEVYVRVARRR